MKIQGLIAARKGSERVPSKNIRPFHGGSLLAIKIRQLLSVPGLDQVVVNSDDPEMLHLARALGVTPIEREPGMGSSAVLSSDFYRSIAGQMDCDWILMVCCTSPFVTTDTIREVLRVGGSVIGSSHDSVNTVTPVREFLWMDGRPINYDPGAQVRSQDLPKVAAVNFAVSLLPRTTMIERGNVVGANPLFVEVSEHEGWDIDTMWDFSVAQLIAEHGVG